MEPAMIQRRVAQARVARLGTISPVGQPHLVPVCFVVDGSRLTTAVDHKPKTTHALQRFKNVRANPKASVLFDHWDEDWAQLWWARGDGVARVVEDGDELTDALDALREKYRAQYGLQAPTGPAIVVDIERWVGWSATG